MSQIKSVVAVVATTATQRFGGRSLHWLAPAIAATSASPEATTPERRQLTVMFCDLVGSTALSTQLDPEDLRALFGAYHLAVREAVATFDGFVAKYMGDGVLVYFGYPRAHEDDPERAIQAGLRAIDAVSQLDDRGVKLQARVGIATGFVVVGDLIGEGSAQEQTVVGETPNLAARLQALASPGHLVIGASTRQQVGELFDLEDLGPQQLAGFADPQPAWMVLRESTGVSRFEALHVETLPLVGRGEEVEVLLRRWENAKRGEGRVELRTNFADFHRVKAKRCRPFRIGFCAKNAVGPVSAKSNNQGERNPRSGPAFVRKQYYR